MIAIKNTYVKAIDSEEEKSIIDSNPTTTEIEPVYDREQMKTLLAFSPNILINQLKQQQSGSINNVKLTHPQSITFNGAALLSDISGFSKFAGVQCARGVLGLSDLHETTNVFLGHFVNTVYRYGGDVIAFAGDALICVFINNPYGLDSSTEAGASMARKLSTNEPYMNIDCNIRALECAMELRQFCTASLSTHIAVSSGEMKLAILGGRNNEWVYLLNGLPVAQLECLTDAGSKQVVCTPELYQQVYSKFRQLGLPTSNLVVSKCKSGNFLCENIHCGTNPSKENYRISNLIEASPQQAISMTKQFISRPVLIAINSGILDRIAELRQVVTMFISLDSYSPDVHRDPMTLQPFFALVQESLQTTGGYMRQFVIDDKGCVVIGMWGLPQYSHVNNGSRALYAAADIRNKARDLLKLKCSVGVTTGFVFCGGVGGPVRKDYVVMGTDVNMAARFMCKANGRVLVDSATKKSLPIFLQNVLKTAEVMHLKGALTAITPFEFQGEDVASIINLGEDKGENEGTTSDLRKNVRTVLNKQLDKIYYSSLRKTSKLLGNITMEQVNHPLYAVILGKEGTGVQTAIDFFAESSRRRNVEYYSYVCKAPDVTKSGSCVLGIFQSMLGSDAFESLASTTRVFTELILETYPRRDEKFRTIKLQQLEDLLNFGNKYEGMMIREQINDIDAVTTKAQKNKFGILPNEVVLYDLFNMLLQKKQVSLCIQDSQFCDLFSWRFLEHQAGGATKFAMLITFAPPELISTSTKVSNIDTMESGTKEDKILKIVKASGGERGLSYIDEFSQYKVSSLESAFNIFRHEYCVVIEMDPLSGQEIKELLCMALGSKKIDQQVVDSVLDVTNGNAYWCKAIVDFIKENGMEEFSRMIMKRGNGHNSLKELILKNIDKLLPEQAVVAKSAAIIGDQFSFSLLRDMLPAQMQKDVASYLEGLRQSGIISNVGGTFADPDFEFQNQLIRNTIYDLTPPGDGAKAHLFIAEIILSKYGKNERNLKQYYERLSYHYRNSNATYRSEAFKYTLRTIDDFFFKRVFELGIPHLEIASNLISRPLEAQILIDLADVALQELRPTGIRMMTYHFHDSTSKMKSDLTGVRNKLIKYISDTAASSGKNNKYKSYSNINLDDSNEFKSEKGRSEKEIDSDKVHHYHNPGAFISPNKVGTTKISPVFESAVVDSQTAKSEACIIM